MLIFPFFVAALLPVLSMAWVPHRHPKVLKTHRMLTPIRPTTLLLAKKSDGGGSKGGGGGGDDGPRQEKKKGAGVATITIDKTKEEVETKFKEKLDEEGWWRVLLHNDEIHTFEYVTEAIVKVVPQLTRKKAFVISRTVHMRGVGTITTVWKSLAEQLCMGMQTFGLTVSIAPDASFENNNIDGEEEG